MHAHILDAHMHSLSLASTHIFTESWRGVRFIFKQDALKLKVNSNGTRRVLQVIILQEWNSKGKHTMLLSQISIFCLSSMCSLSSIPFHFFSSCSSFVLTRCPPVSSFSPRTNNSTSGGFSLHHAWVHYLLFSQHLWGWEGLGYVKESLKISISPCCEVSTVIKYVLKAAEPPPSSALDKKNRRQDCHHHVGGQIFRERHIHSEKWLWSDEFMPCISSRLQWPL